MIIIILIILTILLILVNTIKKKIEKFDTKCARSLYTARAIDNPIIWTLYKGWDSLLDSLSYNENDDSDDPSKIKCVCEEGCYTPNKQG